MSCKSLIRDMRGDSHGLVQVPMDALKQSCCWANMPPDLLSDILMRIERSEDTWPSRKNVVSCAGVCRNWRQIVKEIVKVPEVSSKITFPISLKQPGPRGSLLQCYVKRNRSNETFYLYLGDTPSNDDGKFLLAAKKFKRPTFTEYIISLNCHDFSSKSNTYMGKLRSNYLGTKFTVYDAQPTYPEAQSSSTPVSLKQVSQGIQSGNYDNNFIVSSGRNFQLVAALENENVIFQFAKVGDDLFIMDYQYPISAFQAFTICLSKFGCKPSWTKFILKSSGVVVMVQVSATKPAEKTKS